MKMTPEIKRAIDLKSLKELLFYSRFCPIGHSLFEGETGKYWFSLIQKSDRTKLTDTSNEVGWKRPSSMPDAQTILGIDYNESSFDLF
jgi:hypothetical protein